MADQDTTRRRGRRAIERKLAYLITSSELADIVGVGRSTVSNWRDRYADTFPSRSRSSRAEARSSTPKRSSTG